MINKKHWLAFIFSTFAFMLSIKAQDTDLRAEKLTPENENFVPYFKYDNEHNLKYGLMDSRTKKMTVKATYDFIGQYNGLLLVSKAIENSGYGAHKEGVVDYYGNEIIPMLFGEIRITKNTIEALEKKEKMNSYGDYIAEDTAYYYDRFTLKLLFKLAKTELDRDQNIFFAPSFSNDDTLIAANYCVYSITGRKICYDSKSDTIISGIIGNKIEYTIFMKFDTVEVDSINTMDGIRVMYGIAKQTSDPLYMTLNKQNIFRSRIDSLRSFNLVEEVWSNLYLVSKPYRGTQVFINQNLEITHENNLPLKDLPIKTIDYSYELLEIYPFKDISDAVYREKVEVFNANILLVQKKNQKINRSEQDLAKRYLNNYLYGFIDTTGKFKIMPQYVMAYPFNEGLAAVVDTITYKWSFINESNQKVIQTEWPALKRGSEITAFIGQSHGLVFYDGLCHYIDNENKIESRLDTMYTIDSESRSVIAYRIDTLPYPIRYFTFAYINKKGRTIFTLPDTITYAGNFSNGLAPVVNSSEKLGFIDKKGKLKIDFKYFKPNNFDSSQRFSNNLFLVEIDNGLYGYIGSDGFEYFQIK
jgi:hypothetical protein